MAFGIVASDRGDVRELTDANGTPFAFYSYDVYGNPTSKLSRKTSLIDADVAAAICSGNVVRYAGYVYDQESGLYYLSTRYYDPSTASFLTKDPADADGEESPYQYCGGDPVEKVDPSGENTQYRTYQEVLRNTSLAWVYLVGLNTPWVRVNSAGRIVIPVSTGVGTWELVFPGGSLAIYNGKHVRIESTLSSRMDAVYKVTYKVVNGKKVSVVSVKFVKNIWWRRDFRLIWKLREKENSKIIYNGSMYLFSAPLKPSI